MAKGRRGRERELALLTSLERLLNAMVQKYSRPTQRHDILMKALEHVITERSLLARSLAGDADATRARGMTDVVDSVGE